MKSEIEAELARAWMVDQAWNEAGEKAWDWLAKQNGIITPELHRG